MFWFTEKMRRSLIVLPQRFPKGIQKRLIDYLNEKTKIIFNFEEENNYDLIDREFLFLNALSDFSPKNIDIESSINRALEDKLFYENGEIKNFTGSFGFTFIFEYEGKAWIKKVPYYPTDSFNREYMFASKLCGAGSDFVPMVANYNKDNGSYMQEVAIDSLDNYIESNKDLSDNERLKTAIEIVSSIKHIHSFGIIHRDLHPGNVFLFNNEDIKRWKISDFGLSYDTINKLSCVDKHNGRYGDQDYISPEQKKHLDNATFKSDIYSIGRLINFIFTKKPNNYKHKLGLITTKCCSNNPVERYDNATILLEIILSTINSYHN